MRGASLREHALRPWGRSPVVPTPLPGSSPLRWSGVVVDTAQLYVERVRGPARARWTVRIGERGAVVIEPDSYLDGERSDFPLRTVRSVRVDHESRQRHVVVLSRHTGEVRLVCRDPAAAERIAARCTALLRT